MSAPVTPQPYHSSGRNEPPRLELFDRVSSSAQPCFESIHRPKSVRGISRSVSFCESSTGSKPPRPSGRGALASFSPHRSLRSLNPPLGSVAPCKELLPKDDASSGRHKIVLPKLVSAEISEEATTPNWEVILQVISEIAIQLLIPFATVFLLYLITPVSISAVVLPFSAISTAFVASFLFAQAPKRD